MFKIAFVLSVLVLVSACSEVKKIDEMKDNTSQMNQTTKTLLDKTGEMKDGLDKMSTATDEMNASTKDLRTLTREELIDRLDKVSSSTDKLFDAMRQGDTSHLRRIGMEKILTQTTLQGRVAEAGLYLQGFEFQVLGTVGKDRDQTFREVLYHQGMLEFFLRLDELAPKQGKIWPDAKPSKDDDENRASAFNAIAFALHKTNRQQYPDEAYGKPMSFYDLIIIAMQMKPYIDAGQIILPAGNSWVKEVLGHPERVEQLLQTRYNMFVYGMLGTTTNMSELSTVSQLMKLVFKLDVDLSEATRGVAVLQRIDEEITGPAKRTTDDMLRLGLTPKFSTMTKLALSRINFQFSSKPQKTGFTRTTVNEQSVQSQWDAYVHPDLATLGVTRR